MTAILTTIKSNGNTLYPVTKTNAVSDSNGTDLDSLLAALGQKDSLPTSGSTKPVTSDGLYNKFASIGTFTSSTNETAMSANSTLTLNADNDHIRMVYAWMQGTTNSKGITIRDVTNNNVVVAYTANINGYNQKHFVCALVPKGHKYTVADNGVTWSYTVQVLN